MLNKLSILSMALFLTQTVQCTASVPAFADDHSNVSNYERSEVGDFGDAHQNHVHGLPKFSLPKQIEILQGARRYDESVKLIESKLAANPGNAELLSQLSSVHLRYASDLRSRDDNKGAARQYQLAAVYKKKSIKAHQEKLPTALR